MITKEQLLDSMRHETRVFQHLATKVPEGSYDYRPTPAQRSLLELMQYMTRMAIVPAAYAVRRNWEGAEELEAEAEEVTPGTFSAEMDRQLVMLEELLGGIDEEEAKTRAAAMPWGTPTTLGAGLMDMALKTLVAYRMQLFLYVKACGVAGIGPAECWAGVTLQQ
ncbi:MAG: hypothetical protein ACYTGV_07570 [Planctomycetota bacterium]|jgi:hypothetical protein